MIPATDSPAPTRGKGWSDPARWLLVCLTLAAGLSLVLVIARGFAIFGTLHWFSTSGEEGTVIYGVWKAAHGQPVYQIPGAGLYESAIYNFLFYRCYGGLCALIGADGDQLVMVSRLVTCLSALIGAFAQWRVLGLLVRGPLSGGERWLLATMVALTWYGATFLNWWLVTVRPDVPAVALSMLGMWLWLEAMLHRSAPLTIGAGAAFYLAWAFKQSVVWSLAGAVIGGGLAASTRRSALLLALVTGAAFALTIALGGEAYRYQTLYVSSLFAIVPLDCIMRSQQLLVPLILFWFFALVPWVLGRLGVQPLFPVDAEVHAQARRVVGIASIIAVVMGVIAFGKDGSGRNHLMEGVVLVSTLAAANLVRVLRLPVGGWRTGLIIVACLFALILCGRPNNSLILDDTGIKRGNSQDVAFHRELADVVANLPKPAYVDDDILAQPFYTTNGNYPAYVPDILMYLTLKRHHLVTDGGLSYLVSHGTIQSILVCQNPIISAELLDPALAAGFETKPLPAILAKGGYQLLVRPQKPTASR